MSVDGKNIATEEDLINAINMKKPGDDLVVVAIRAGSDEEVTVSGKYTTDVDLLELSGTAEFKVDGHTCTIDYSTYQMKVDI